MLYNKSVQDEAKNSSIEASEKIIKSFKQESLNFSLLGPAPAFIPKINNKYYFQIIIKLLEDDEDKVIKAAKLLNKTLDENWSIDIDPSDLL